MNIADIWKRGKTTMEGLPSHAVTVSILILATTAAFGLGILAGKDMSGTERIEGEEFWIEDRGGTLTGLPATKSALPAAAIEAITGTPGVGFVASKNGTKYYLPACGGATRIKEENKVWYATKEDAEAVGLTPAANCPGL